MEEILNVVLFFRWLHDVISEKVWQVSSTFFPCFNFFKESLLMQNCSFLVRYMCCCDIWGEILRFLKDGSTFIVYLLLKGILKSCSKVYTACLGFYVVVRLCLVVWFVLFKNVFIQENQNFHGYRLFPVSENKTIWKGLPKLLSGFQVCLI